MGTSEYNLDVLCTASQVLSQHLGNYCDKMRVVVVAAVLAVATALTVEEKPIQESVGTGRTLDEWARSFWSWMGYDEDEYYDYEYEFLPPSGSGAAINYGLPQVGYVPPSAGGLESTYTSYDPYRPPSNHLGHPARDDSVESEWGITGMLYDMAVTAIPVALLMAALPSTLFTVAIRRRSFDDTLLESDFLSLANRDCQEKLFCELAQIGEMDNASFLQRAMYYVATLTPDFLARRVGMERLFQTSRHGHCEVLSCSSTASTRLALPKVLIPPSHTNAIDDLSTHPEKEASEVAKE